MAKRNDDRRTFRVRLNCVDHYQTAPSTLDPPLWGPSSFSTTQRNDRPHVPVIRVFGATETGQKVCAHIHGAFPYLFVPYAEARDPATVEQYTTALRHSIDHTLALSYRRNPYGDPRSAQFVAHIGLVKGVPFFGYQVGYKYFLKISLLNPAHMTRFADLLQQGAILQRVFQPYEAHLQYLLQWMCDFNLYGCAFIETDKPHFRLPLPIADDTEHVDGWHDESIHVDQILDDDKFPRQSHCTLEVDFRVEDILNRHEVKARDLHHSFIERLSSLDNLPPEEKLVHSMAGLWKDETKRRKRRMGLTDPSSSPFPPEVLVSMSADPRNTDQAGWIHEDEFREMVEELAQQERKSRGGHDLNFESFLSQKTDDDGVQTVLESVEQLFHKTLADKFVTVKDEDPTDAEPTVRPPSTAQHVNGLDESTSESGPSFDMNSIAEAEDEGYDSDEDAARTRALTQRERLEDAGLDGAMGEAKVAGDADDIEQRAKTVSDASVPARTVDAAEKSPVKRDAPTQTQGPFKRVKFSDEANQKPRQSMTFNSKQNDTSRTGLAKTSAAFVFSEHPPGAQSAVKDAPGHPDPPLAAPPPPSSQRSNVSSQSSQSKTLSYPVVKNVHDSPIQARLGQDHESRSGEATSLPKRQKVRLGQSSDNSSKNESLSSDEVSWKSPGKPMVDPRVASRYAASFNLRNDADIFIFGVLPPSCEEVEATVEPSVVYQDAYYSNEKDVPERPREYAGQEFRLESTTLPYLPEFDKTGAHEVSKGVVLDKTKEDLVDQRRRRRCTLRKWEIMSPPPTFAEVQQWLRSDVAKTPDDLDELEVDGPPATQRLARDTWAKPAALPQISQIEGPTQKNRHGFKFSQHRKSTSVQHETGYMSTMSLEVHVNSRDNLAPDPERDEVSMAVWCLAQENMAEDVKMGIVVMNPEGDDLPERIRKIVGGDVEVEAEDSELEILNRVVDIVRHYDPDILTGYEVHNSSWGYLIERARLQYEFNLPDEFSRMRSHSHGRFGKDADRWGFTHTSTVRITGRHTINIWRAMRSELNLLQYTMENVVFHLLHQRIPHYSFATLTKWFTSKRPKDLFKAIDYFTSRTNLDLQVLDANELIPRTSEQARLLGVDFFSVFSRGSQFKVESLMFRIAKPESFLLVSPSRKQVGAQNALECLPLVMEPQSAFYNSPLLVLDFQSLYPSVMIAYNYCYSTCLGRITSWRGTNKMGFADFQRAPGLLELVKDKLNIAPNGMMYVKPEMRKSLLAKMLGEILETRVMVKSGMKVDKDDRTLQQLLNNRQLALKLIANVTYGYTSASFSGRMPCSEIADSIVQTGRETLEKAIAFIHSVERWGAEVVYGDTDSLFVYLKGRTRADAFKIGDEIAKAVTDMNPRPVKLKFEKVYHPCVLLAKKRYVGYKYESPKQTEPEFDAKGIETVRRDGTPAEQKIEEKALKLLFRTSDLSKVKEYFQQQCTKIMTGRFSIQDFCFAKEVKLGTYSDRGPPPPGALIATKRMLRDPRTEPQYGERVPYVVIAGAPGARLWERCVEPERLVHDEFAELDAEYYISKNLIPPLERIFNLVGANVRAWYDEMPKVQRIRMLGGPREGTDAAGKGPGSKRATMESYMGSSLCLVCRTKLAPVDPTDTVPLPLCEACRVRQPQATLLALRAKLSAAEKKVDDLRRVCRSCADLAPDEQVRCDSRDCPVFYSRVKAETRLTVERSGSGRVLDALAKEVSGKVQFEW